MNGYASMENLKIPPPPPYLSAASPEDRAHHYFQAVEPVLHWL